MFVPNVHILKWRILKVGLVQKSFAVQLTRDLKEIKVEAILKHVSGSFLVGFTPYRKHFLHVCLKYPHSSAEAPYGECF